MKRTTRGHTIDGETKALAFALYCFQLSHGEIAHKLKLPQQTIHLWSAKEKWTSKREMAFAEKMGMFDKDFESQRNQHRLNEADLARRCWAQAMLALSRLDLRKPKTQDIKNLCEIASLLGRVRLLLAEYKPDVLWIDPVLAYIGGEANSQKDVGGFLRNGLNPLLREFDCAAVVIHHTNKPAAGREKPNWQAGDYAYLGAGSAEFANWARAVLAMRAIGSHTVFELRAAKRGARLDWRDDQEQKSFVKHIAHAKEPGVICWRESGPDEIESSGGRPKTYDPDELLDLLPPDGLATAQWITQAKSECGVSEATLHRERRAFAKAGRIKTAKRPKAGLKSLQEFRP